ncbi:MAG TPA: hypothetical protein VGF67_17060 [Ktedonobacteraceae bacterium]|jgi:tetratricopeptide (TPR) repeat protein
MDNVFFKLVCMHWISAERTKYVWEDFSIRPIDEIVGRMYLLKAHDEVDDARFDKARYTKALSLFERALASLTEPAVNKDYYYRALADKALAQCLLGQTGAAVALFEEAYTNLSEFYHFELKVNWAAALVLSGACAQALALLDQEPHKASDREDIMLIRAACLLQMERYDEAIVAYEQIHRNYRLHNSRGLEAARGHRQPDWDHLE